MAKNNKPASKQVDKYARSTEKKSQITLARAKEEALKAEVKKSARILRQAEAEAARASGKKVDDEAGQVIDSMGEFLKSAREHCGYSLSKLAKLSGVDRTAIGRLENEQREGRFRTVLKLTNALGVSFEELLDFTHKHNIELW